MPSHSIFPCSPSDLVQHFFNAPGDELPPDWLLPKLLSEIPLAESASKLETVVANPFRFTSFLAAAMFAVVLIWWSVGGWVLEICATKQGSEVRAVEDNRSTLAPFVFGLESYRY